MSIDHTLNMLETLKYYCDSEITQTFSNDKQQVLSVCYLKNNHSFEITYTETNIKKNFRHIESAAEAIEKALR
ncbi:MULTISPECIES: hypothetical protein [Cytobacillus]|jgi:uncharacterized protein YkuJ|uniref:Uncharacterized protein n=4 Tax=Cytobacillus TaxID=2675230 RepID=A0A366JN41_CYTFI|nr:MULTISPECIES: hypothetical protein [Cytobacillus]EFV74720.1 hypothetical protein HMPREF1013_04978 [Bacillus sp. 2_A_57_CT2]AND38041.1 hypothetical protein A361_02395 [Cytobacillus oceanisediminis 2691]MBU8733399.1 hypothetical protein [Cytobacillus oceanisediminis]MBY0158061.1 hypothetical protein [Cytobacillus firmus]MCM3245545.1 hypothetical protein [Cytobacillus oceanisediminis]